MPRNSSGTYTLPSGNPVVTNTLIESVWANNTMSDLGQAMTESLDRYGRGGMLAPLKLADGAVTAPAFAFNSEASTGLYRPSAGNLGFAVLGIQVFNLGSASAAFSVQPTYGADPVSANDLTRRSWVLSQISGSVSGYLPLTGGTLSGPGNLTVGGNLSVTGTSSLTGNVGINTATANAKLHLTNSPPAAVPTWSAVDNAIFSNTSNGVIQLHAGDTAGSLAYAFARGTVRSAGALTYITGSDAMTFTTNSAEQMRINSSGNVGIGTISPGQRLAVSSPNPANGYVASLSNSQSSAGRTGTYLLLDAPSLADWKIGVPADVNAFSIFDVIAGAERLRIDSSGNVGIGTSSPVSAFDVRRASGGTLVASASATNYGFMQWVDSGGYLRVATDGAFYIRFDTNASERMRIDSAGQVGIGKTPTQLLDVSGTSAASGTQQISLTNTQSSTGISLITTGTTFSLGGVGGSAALIAPASSNTNLALGNLSSGTGIVQFVLGGSERMRIDASGNIGLGTTGPDSFAGYIGQTISSTTGAFIFVKSTTGTITGELVADNSVSAVQVGARTAHNLQFVTSNTSRMVITAAGVIQDAAGLELGYKVIPRIASGGGTAATTVRGQCYATTAGITVPASTFAAGDCFSIYNDSASAITITQGASLTLRQVGTTNTGNRTLAARGFATVWFNSATEAVISGGGVS